MINTALRGERLLQNTEAELQKLMGEAASAGDYESALVLTKWASEVASLRSRYEATLADMLTRDVAEQGVAATHPTRGPRRTKKRAKQRRAARPEVPSGYPKFVRRGEEIIKIGWSKRSKSEYLHKAPRKAMLLLTAAIAAQAASGSLVTANDLLPLADPSDGAEIPDYQVYVCLAWLRHEGLIEQEGRQGYIVSDLGSFEKRVSDKWEAIPSK